MTSLSIPATLWHNISSRASAPGWSYLPIYMYIYLWLNLMDSNLIVRVQSSICIRVFNLELAHHRSRRSLFLLDCPSHSYIYIYIYPQFLFVFFEKKRTKVRSSLRIYFLSSPLCNYSVSFRSRWCHQTNIYIYFSIIITGLILQPRPILR